VEKRPEWSNIIQPGLDKLEEYKSKLNDAHILAMGGIYFIFKIDFTYYIAIDPGNKLNFFL
jgi:hypothetical protein